MIEMAENQNNGGRTLMCANGHRIKASEAVTIHCSECGETLHTLVVVMLVKQASGNNFSIEAGIADRERNFDHHGKMADQSAPCSDARIPVIPKGVIEITHLDADTLIGIMRMLGDAGVAEINPQRFHDYGSAWRSDVIDLALMAKIDTQGSSFLSQNGLENTTRQWMVGVTQLAQKLKLPRWEGKDVDVTGIVEQIIAYSDEEIIQVGKEAMVRGEEAYQKAETNAVRASSCNGIRLFQEKLDEPIDPSRPYADGYHFVVIFRKWLGQIGVYINPKVNFTVGGKVFAGIKFEGQAKAAGSPRGESFTLEQANSVVEAAGELMRISSTYKDRNWVTVPGGKVDVSEVMDLDDPFTGSGVHIGKVVSADGTKVCVVADLRNLRVVSEEEAKKIAKEKKLCDAVREQYPELQPELQ